MFTIHPHIVLNLLSAERCKELGGGQHRDHPSAITSTSRNVGHGVTKSGLSNLMFVPSDLFPFCMHGCCNVGPHLFVVYLDIICSSGPIEYSRCCLSMLRFFIFCLFASPCCMNSRKLFVIL